MPTNSYNMPGLLGDPNQPTLTGVNRLGVPQNIADRNESIGSVQKPKDYSHIKQIPGLMTPVSPAVVTSDSARDTVTEQRDQLEQTGIRREDELRKMGYDTAEWQKEREAAKLAEEDRDLTRQTLEGEQPEEDPMLSDYLSVLKNQQDQIAAEARAQQDRLNQIRIDSQDPAVNHLLRRVQAEYEAKAKAQQEQNEQLMRATEVSTIRTGLSRLAQFRATSIMSAEESAGLSRMEELANQKLQAEIAAMQAFETGEFQIFSAQMEIMNNAADQQRQVAKDMYTAVQKSKEDAIAQARETREAIKFEFDMQEKTADNIATVLVDSAEEITPEMLQEVANDYGMDPNTLLAKIRNVEVERRKQELDIEYQQARIADIYQGMSGGDTANTVGQLLNIFGPNIEEGLAAGKQPGSIAQEISLWAQETGMKFDAKDYSALVDVINTYASAGSEELAEDATLPDDRGAGFAVGSFAKSAVGGIQGAGRYLTDIGTPEDRTLYRDLFNFSTGVQEGFSQK